MPEDNNNNRASALSKLNLFLILLIIVIAVLNEAEQDSMIRNLYESMISFDKSQQTVDFTVSDIQEVSDGFLLAQAAQEKHLTGIKFSGRIINTMAVNHHNITFKLTVDEKDKDFTINKISSGNSTGFKVYVPDIKAENARYVQIKYQTSSIAYQYK